MRAGLIKKMEQKGDTIVEVMISMAVLAIVITVAYATSTRSLHASLDSQYRDQAVSYAQQQLELLKNADSNGSAVIANYKVTSNPFCVRPNDMIILNAADASNPCNIPIGGWGSTGDGMFKISTVYTGDPPAVAAGTRTFAVTVSWDSAENRPQQTVVYYKTNDSYLDNGALPPTTPITTNPPIATVTLSDNSGGATKTFGSTVQLSWSTTNVLPGSCITGLGPWASPGPRGDSGSQTSGALNVSPTTTFSLSCKDLLGVNVIGYTNVSVSPPPTPVITAFNTWSEPTIYTNLGAPRYLFWNTNVNAVSCNLSGPGANYTGLSPNSYVYINVYAGTYTLTCFNSFGSPTTATFAFNYIPSYFVAYQHAGFDGSWPGWVWGPVGEGYQGLPADMSSHSVYGRAAVYDNAGNCASFYPGAGWQFYAWVEDYGLQNDNFGAVWVGHDCAGN
jgi:prepilin-type N-terminal cleavage/methylation domain-containing protein